MEKKNNNSGSIKNGGVIAAAVLIIIIFAAAIFFNGEKRGNNTSEGVLTNTGGGTDKSESGKNVKKSGKKGNEPLVGSEFALDTAITVMLYDSDDQEILDGALALCSKYENIFSATFPESELYKLNHRTAQTVKVDSELAYVIDRGLYYSKLSGGAFDITIEPVKKLWDFKAEKPSLPDEGKLSEALGKVGYENVEVNQDTVTFKDPDTSIDLGAIAKGYIADRIKEYLVEKGVKSAIINLGGNVLCIGRKPNGSDFVIGLQRPFSESVFETIVVNDISVVTSGVYERYFTYNGKNYHHILNPADGYPYDNGVLGVSIVCKNSIDADALSTTCFSLGAEKGIELLDSIPDAYGFFILDDYSIKYSKGTEDLIAK